MRVIGGRFRRAPLKAPEGHDVRPTTDRVREAVFNLLQTRIDFRGARVLDLFAGSGALGIEALSRGAREAVFVEADASVLRIAAENATSLGLAAFCTFVRADALRWMTDAKGDRFDLILADPPYDLAELPALPPAATARLSPGGIFVLEHDRRISFDEAPSIELSRTYGRTVISMFGA